MELTARKEILRSVSICGKQIPVTRATLRQTRRFHSNCAQYLSSQMHPQSLMKKFFPGKMLQSEQLASQDMAIRPIEASETGGYWYLQLPLTEMP